MRPRALVVLLALGVLVALVAGAATFADSPGGRQAFALVVPNNGTPRLVSAHTSGFVDVSVGPFGPGDYCLTPAPGVDVVDTAAVAAQEAFYSNVFGRAMVRYPTAGPRCDANQLEVKTWPDNSPTLTDQIAFTVIVP